MGLPSTASLLPVYTLISETRLITQHINVLLRSILSLLTPVSGWHEWSLSVLYQISCGETWSLKVYVSLRLRAGSRSASVSVPLRGV